MTSSVMPTVKRGLGESWRSAWPKDPKTRLNPWGLTNSVQVGWKLHVSARESRKGPFVSLTFSFGFPPKQREMGYQLLKKTHPNGMQCHFAESRFGTKLEHRQQESGSAWALHVPKEGIVCIVEEGPPFLQLHLEPETPLLGWQQNSCNDSKA